jgi:hypothetical protein
VAHDIVLKEEHVLGNTYLTSQKTSLMDGIVPTL